MKTSFLTLILLVGTSNGVEETKEKRGIFREGIHGAKNAIFNHEAIYKHGTIDTIDLGPFVTQHVTITKNIEVLVPQPYPVIVSKNIAVPPVHVANSYPVAIKKPIPYRVQYVAPIKEPIEVPVYETAKISEPVLKSVPYLTKSGPTVSIGSGSLGYVHLGNGVYAIGSGSLGYSLVD